jgi:ketose-bisphosphate aldolase
MKAPLIIQTSVTPSKFLNAKVLANIYKTMAESAPIPICLHLDHCTDVEYCKTCADAGYTNIMIDASKQDFKDNIRQTREVSDYCHGIGGISVEGELGTVSGVEDQIKIAQDEAALCDPEQALEFVEKTRIDIFAPAIGTAHGVYKTKNPKLDFDRMDKIFKLINGKGVKTPLVVHGGTGLQPDVVKRLVSLGGSKFNVSTDLKHVLIDATYGYIASHREEYNPGKIDIAVREAIMAKIEYWIDLLDSAGKA